MTRSVENLKKWPTTGGELFNFISIYLFCFKFDFLEIDIEYPLIILIVM